MTADDITPAERDAVQEHYLRRYLEHAYPRGIRRRTDADDRLKQRTRSPRWGRRLDRTPAGFDQTPRGQTHSYVNPALHLR